MRRLLEDFDTIFDLGYRVGDETLGELIERALDGLVRRSVPEWGSPGARETISAETDSFTSFYYRPHLFPGMDLKLRLAHELQFHLLPRELPPGAPVSIASVLESYCHLSGDLFGWEMLHDGRFLVWIVDISGHGVRAGLASAVLKLLIDQVRERSMIDRFMTSLNRDLSSCLRDEHRGLFATGFFLAIAPDGSADYGSGGHPPMLVRRNDGTIETLDSLDLPIGMFTGTQYSSRKLELGSGDLVLLYSDGLPEAEGRDGEIFGLPRLHRLLEEKVDAPEQLTSSIYDEIVGRQDIDKLEDDITFLVVRVP